MNLQAILLAAVGFLVFTVIINLILQRYFYLQTKVKETIKDKIVLKIAVPVKNDKKALAAEQLFQSLHGIIKNDIANEHFSFEIFAAHHGIYFVVVCPERYKTFVENQIYAQYPEAQISAVPDYGVIHPGENVIASELGLAKEYFLPIRTFVTFEVDPLASITSAISNLLSGYEVWIQILGRPIPNKWQEKGKKYIDAQKNKVDAAGVKIPLEASLEENLAVIAKKSDKVGFQFRIRIIVKGPDTAVIKRLLEDTEASFKQFQTAKQNSIAKPKPKKGLWVSLQKTFKPFFLGKRLGDKINILQKYLLRFIDENESNIVNIEELASLYHLPNESVKTPNISWAKSKKLEFPLNLPI